MKNCSSLRGVKRRSNLNIEATDCHVSLANRRFDGVNDRKISQMKQGFVYLMTNKNNTTIYVGITTNLIQRVYQHKSKIYKGFTSKYNCLKLVYFEEYSDISLAIEREKKLKSGNRLKKVQLIQTVNPEWKDISEDWVFETK